MKLIEMKRAAIAVCSVLAKKLCRQSSPSIMAAESGEVRRTMFYDFL
jgi:hypothetical protein